MEMNVVLMLNVFEFLEKLGKDFECEVILTEENNIDYFVFEQPKYELFEIIDDYIIKDEYIFVSLYGLRRYIRKNSGIAIKNTYDIIETNLDGTPQEYLIYNVYKENIQTDEEDFE